MEIKMDIDLPDYILNDLFAQHEDERDSVRAGIPSVMLMKYWASRSYRRQQEIGYKSQRKRKYGKKYKPLKF